MKIFFSMPRLALLLCGTLLYLPEAQADTKKSSAKKTGGSFALITAVRDGNLEKVKQLLATENINVNQQTSEDAQKHTGGNTALHIAVERLRKGPVNGPYLPITLALIADRRVNVSIPNKAGQTPLHLLAGITKEPADANAARRVEKSRPDLAQVAERLLAKGAQINVKDREGLTPLHRAAIEGIPSLVFFLIRHNADINARTARGQTALMKAAQKGHSQIIAQLIAAGADLNAQDPVKGRTALHWVQRMREGAVKKAGTQMPKERALLIITQLLQAGADPTIKDFVTDDNPVARSPIDWAAVKSPWSANNNPELELLKAASANVAQNTPAVATPKLVTSTDKRPTPRITPKSAAIMMARATAQSRSTQNSNVSAPRQPITQAPITTAPKLARPVRNVPVKRVRSHQAQRPQRTIMRSAQRPATGRHRYSSHRVQTGHSPFSRRRVRFAEQPTIIPRRP